MQESRQRCVKFVFLVGHGQFVLASGRLAEFYLRCHPFFEASGVLRRLPTVALRDELFVFAHCKVAVLEHFIPLNILANP